MTEETLFHKALAKPPHERADFLNAACAGQSELRAAVEALLAAHDASGNLLDRPPAELAQTLDSGAGMLSSGSPVPLAATTDQPPLVAAATVIAGRYTLVERIGEGGMGEVWVAKQTEPVKRKVALKLIKPGMNSKGVLARFEQERQALAVMDHPNIAKVLDGGVTESGRPFFVMELVNGLPLNKFCDESKLTIPERLELFTAVCQAIQHAHQKGIIHRDLKPSNVLVTRIDGKPVPKVIDFGVAKATAGRLTDSSLSTQFGAVVGTLEYMSPEQAAFSGDDIDTRADIYSLGVILYELLTGLRPIDAGQLQKAGLLEMFRIIKEVEPSRPSTRLSSEGSAASLAALRHTDPKRLTSLLRGELDWVVMRCLEKQRDRRYETANGLGRDIKRYLADEPVEARPPTVAYRLQKFIRRNQGRVIAAVLVLLALVAGIVGTSWGMITARQALDAEAAERRLAEQARVTAESEKDQKERERKRADDERRRADEKAADALSAKRLANQSAAKALAEKERAEEERRRANAKAAEAMSEKERAEEERRRANAKAAEAMSEKERADRKTAEALTEKARAEDQLFRSESLLYSNQIALARRDWEANNVAGAWQHLNACRAEFRGWEHNYLYTLFTQGQQTLARHANNFGFETVAYSPDGKRIAAGNADGTVKVWDVSTGRELLTLGGQVFGSASSVAFSPDGKSIVSSHNHNARQPDDDKQANTVKVWDQSSEKVVPVYANTVTVWDLANGKEILTFKGHRSTVESAAFSPDGKRIVSRSADGILKLWDAASGSEIFTLKDLQPGRVCNVVFSPDGKHIAGGGPNLTARIWEAGTGRDILTLKGHQGFVTSVAYSPDGTRIAAGSADGTVKLWDAATGRELLTLGGRLGVVRSVAFSGDGTKIVTASWSDALVKVWDATDGREILSLKGHTDAVTGVAFSPDGDHIASASDDATVKVWDAKRGQEIAGSKAHGSDVECLAFGPDGKLIASSGCDVFFGPWFRTAKLRDAASGSLLATKRLTGAINLKVAFSPDLKRAASGGSDALLKVWDLKSGQDTVTVKQRNDPTGKQHEDYVDAVAFSADGTRIVGCGREAAIVWDAATGRELLNMRGQLICVAFSPDGKRIASSGAFQANDWNVVKVWDAATGRQLHVLKGHSSIVRCVAFSADGKRIVSGSDDASLKVWDVASGGELFTLKGHVRSVQGAAFSPDGRRIASGSWDGTLKVWDATTGQEMLTLKASAGVNCLAFSPDGARIASGSSDGILKFWDASRCAEKPVDNPQFGYKKR
jgi:eukaryotic-like serine/threonine-protein kinase